MIYKTINESANAELIIKKSRFIAVLVPLGNAQEAESILSDIKREYPGANHYCFAWIIRQEGNKAERCSDDGEPAGTAGWPILNVLQKMDLEDLMAVVVRYFGGTLLGTGGLVKAYTQSVQAVLEEIKIINMEYCQMILLTFDYSYYGSFEKQFSHISGYIKDVQFTDRVHIKIWIPIDRVDAFITKINNLSVGTATVVLLQQEYVPR